MTKEVKIYHVTDTGLAEGTALGRISVYLASDYAALEQECERLRADNKRLLAALALSGDCLDRLTLERPVEPWREEAGEALQART